MSKSAVYAVINHKYKQGKTESSEARSVADDATYSNVHISAPGRSDQGNGDGSHCVVYSKLSLPRQEDAQPPSQSGTDEPAPRSAPTERGQWRGPLKPTQLLPLTCLLCTLLLVVIFTLCALYVSSGISNAEKLNILERNNTEAWRQSSHLHEELSESNRTVKHLQNKLGNQTEEIKLLLRQLSDSQMGMQQLQSNYITLLREQQDIQAKLDTFKATSLAFKAEVSSKSGEGWKYFNGKWYYFSWDSKTWEESRQACKGKGGDLVIIETQEEQEYISSYSKGKGTYWIGLRYEKGAWLWVNDKVLTTPRYFAKDGNMYQEPCFLRVQNYNKADLYNWYCGSYYNNNKCICQRLATA